MVGGGRDIDEGRKEESAGEVDGAVGGISWERAARDAWRSAKRRSRSASTMRVDSNAECDTL